MSAGKLGRDLGVAPATIEKYLRLLEQSFVIRRIYSFSRNYANELKKSYKVYFIDVGVRNALIGNFELDDKNAGVLFENMFFTEKFKEATLSTFPKKLFFWRTKQGIEIDCIETNGDEIIANECKYGSENFSFTSFKKYYPNAETNVIRFHNFL